jgi:hypothetical protein
LKVRADGASMTPEELRARLKSSTQKRTFFTYSNVLSTISLVVTLIGLSATIYYNFLWHPEHLQMTYRVTHEKMDVSQASFVFINNGRQAVAVDMIKLMATVDNSPEDACKYSNSYRQKEVAQTRNWERVETLPTGGSYSTGVYFEGREMQYLDRPYETIRPRKVVVDNKDVEESYFLVESQSAKVVNIEYQRSFDGTTNKIFCFEVRVFDRLGDLHIQVLPAWTVIREKYSRPDEFIIGYASESDRHTVLLAR